MYNTYFSRRNKMAFVGILSQRKLLFGPLVIQLVWYILKPLFTQCRWKWCIFTSPLRGSVLVLLHKYLRIFIPFNISEHKVLWYKNKVFNFKQNGKISDFCLNEGQRMRGRVPPPHLRIYQVTPPPGQGMETDGIGGRGGSRPALIVLVKCWKVTRLNAKTLSKHCQNSIRLLPKSLDIFI